MRNEPDTSTLERAEGVRSRRAPRKPDAAAAELNVAHAAVSRHIRTLKSSLRVALFERTGRGVRLTDNGRELARSLTEAFDLIANATTRYARSPRRRQRLKITSDVAFATHWLVSRLGRFTSEHPGIELVLEPTPRLVDFSKEDFDLGIRCGAGAWRNIEAEKIADAGLSVVCSPHLLKTKRISISRRSSGRCLDARAGPGSLAGVARSRGRGCHCALGPIPPRRPDDDGRRGRTGFCVGRSHRRRRCAAHRTPRCALRGPIEPYAYYLVHRQGGPMSKAACDFRAWIKGEIARTLATLRHKLDGIANS